MASALPIVVTDVSGVKDLLPRGEADGGIVVPAEDRHALAGALLRLLSDPHLRRSLGARARRRVEDRFSVEAVGPRLRQFLFSQ
jgi:glycosyltransferase involved in cell wall biosynthesis